MFRKTIKKMAAAAILTAAVMTACGGSAEKSSARQPQENSAQAEVATAETSDVQTETVAATVDVSRIVGRWFSEEKHWFESGAEYIPITINISDNGTISVEFYGRRVGKLVQTSEHVFNITNVVLHNEGEEEPADDGVLEYIPESERLKYGNDFFRRDTNAPQAETQPASDVSPSVMFVNSTNTGHLNMRAEPNANSALILPIPHGAEVNVSNIGASGNWVRVSYRNREGFVNRTFLSATQPTINRDRRLINRKGEKWYTSESCCGEGCSEFFFNSGGDFISYIINSGEGRTHGTWHTVGKNLILIHPTYDSVIDYNIESDGYLSVRLDDYTELFLKVSCE